MKVIFYNLGYARGISGSMKSHVQFAHRFVYQSVTSQITVMDIVSKMITQEQPDVFAYAEVGLGSPRTNNFNQHTYLKEQFTAEMKDSAASKYGESFFAGLPFHRGNGNGLISFVPAEITAYYLRNSRKKLVFICKTESLTVFAVHLPLISSDRALQLVELSDLVNQTTGDVIVCGDFNIFNGMDELAYIMKRTSLQLVSEGMQTFPAYSPRIQLDVFLYRFGNPNVTPKQKTLPIFVSDHLPIVLEW
jgi:endonuclease/exonuclease/phosphatase family metal-dependent hydrolase